jgi:hypothetical protein
MPTEEEVNKPEDPDQEKPKKTPKQEEKKQADRAGEVKEPAPALVKKRFPIAEFLMSLPEEDQSAFGSKVVASYNDKSMSRASSMWLIGQHIDQLIEKYKHKI